MDANSFTVSRFKMQCNKFSGIISKGLNKAKSRLVKQMIYGIQASKDVKLSNISRALQEEIPLIKTEDRLSRNLGVLDLTDHINHQILRLGSGKVDESMVISIDPGDIMKPYARKMEHLCRVYDASAHNEKAIGYHLCQVTAANLEHNKVVPLYCEAYSSKAPDFCGITGKIKQVISLVKKSVGTQGIWAIDRQGDNNEIINHFGEEELSFVCRLKLNRRLHINNKTLIQVKADKIKSYVSLKFNGQLTTIKDGKENQVQLKLGAVTASLPNKPGRWFTLVVVDGFGDHPMLLLTNARVNLKDVNSIWRILDVYLTRWKCDECYRYIKQSYNLEDLRVMGYKSIRNIVVFVHAIAYFASVYMGLCLKMKIMVQKIYILSKRFFGVPSFYHYAMADGIFELLRKTSSGIEKFVGKRGHDHSNFQLDLFPT